MLHSAGGIHAIYNTVPGQTKCVLCPFWSHPDNAWNSELHTDSNSAECGWRVERGKPEHFLCFVTCSKVIFPSPLGKPAAVRVGQLSLLAFFEEINMNCHQSFLPQADFQRKLDSTKLMRGSKNDVLCMFSF